MGFFSFRRGRKTPSPISPFSLFPVKSTEKIPDCLPPQPQSPGLLDRFSQDVGSATSPSGWVMPDFIISHVGGYPRGSSTSQSPKSNNDDFEDPFLHLRDVDLNDFDDFEDTPLHLRGGNMDDFDECDPNSPGALERYTSWIDRDYYDEQPALLQGIQNTQQITQQVSPHIDPRFNPRTLEGVSQQYPANVRLYPQIFHPRPSVDDSDDDEEVDEFTNNGYGRLLSSPSVSSDSDGCYESDDCSDSENDIAVRMGCRGLGRHGQGRIQHYDGHVIRCYAPPNPPDLPMATSLTVSSSSEYFNERPCYWDSKDDEEVEDDWIHVRNQGSENSYVIRCYAPDFPMAPDSLMTIGCSLSEYGADSEASQSMWNSNRAILLGSDLPDYEEVENWDYIWNSNDLGSLPNQVTEADFWNPSAELCYLISRFFGFFDIPNSPATADSVYEPCILPEEIDELTEQSLFSPTSVCSDNAHEPDNALLQQHPFSPSSPAARHSFSPAFAWPAPHDPFIRLQSPAPFNWSQINRIDSYRDVYYCPRLLPSNFGTPKPTPTIFDEPWYDSAYPPQVIICYGPRPRTLTFGSGTCDHFPFTFKHDEPPFPPVGCLCKSPLWCTLHPLGQFLGKRSALVRRR